MRVIQQPSVATLKPARNDSVNFDTTQNLFIEGDNLEVLKLLQRSYFGKVKMIYIDPPYNTGKEFIYPDDYSETLDTYLKYTGQKDSEGRNFSTNTDTAGRFHSNWLNMMYPRLYLAKNLLRDDGVIFISIDDHEVGNLRKLSDEIFGENNFVGVFVINSTPNARDYGHIGKMHEYVLMYVRNYLNTETHQIPEIDKNFKYSDEIGGFNIHPLYNSNVTFNKGTSPNLYYAFYINPEEKSGDFYSISLQKQENFIEVFPPTSQKEQIQFVWRWGKEKSQREINKEIVGYKTSGGEFRIVQKMRHTSKLIRSLLSDKKYSTRRGTAEVEKIFNKKIYSFPKPISLIKDFITAGTTNEDIILDFFAGSSTTAHAVLEKNLEDKTNRRFIMVQLPEKLNMEKPEQKAAYELCRKIGKPGNIAEISKERIRRAAKKIKEEQNSQLDLKNGDEIDLGFKVFKLSHSNFNVWDNNAKKSEENLQQQLLDHVEHVNNFSTPEDILYELLLKNGELLTIKIEKIKISGKDVFSINDKGGETLICLEDKLNEEIIDAMAVRAPQRIICLDRGFNNNDQLKANAFQTFKGREILFATV